MNKVLTQLADRTVDVLPVVNALVDDWGFSLENRNPGVAYQKVDGKPFAVTDLDLACFLTNVCNRRGVINIPKYKRTRQATAREGEVVMSHENRRGPVIGLFSNQKVFAFGVTIEDVQVMTADKSSAPRDFHIQGIDGEWGSWSSIELIPSGLDAEIFDKLTAGLDQLVFTNFIHPLRWVSVFGESFRNAKFAADYRLKEEISFLTKEITRLRELLNIAKKDWGSTYGKGETVPVKAWAYSSEIDGVVMTGEFASYPDTREGFDAAVQRKKRLSAQQGVLRFHVRASEYAWFEHLWKMVGPANLMTWLGGTFTPPKPVNLPVWMKDKPLQLGWRPKGGRKDWGRVDVEPGVAYRFNLWGTKQNVDPEMAEKLKKQGRLFS